MSLNSWFLITVFFLNMACIMLVFVGYPALLLIFSVKKKPKKENIPDLKSLPFVSVIVVFRNAETLIQQKIMNFFDLDYPNEKLELILISDGSTDQSLNLVKPHLSSSIRLFHFNDHKGKHHGLNFGVEQSRGDLLVFSDADALLERRSIKIFSCYFSAPDMGGVCGQRMFGRADSSIKSGQFKYVKWDSWIKWLETKNGINITSHDGKLYAIRKKLFKPVPEGVTDDAYVSLSVIGQDYRFVFDPQAIAYINIPARHARHELKRRIRIVTRSLNGLKINRKLLNPFRFGFFSIGLFINKILRRVVPFCMVLILACSYLLSKNGMILASFVLWLQIVGYAASFSHTLFRFRVISNLAMGRYLKRMSEAGFFFCLGMLGTMMGVLFFLSGKKITKWEPEKG
jgi:poly-beta-1,6-N-acetyl-D-glucosamine synthase